MLCICRCICSVYRYVHVLYATIYVRCVLCTCMCVYIFEYTCLCHNMYICMHNMYVWMSPLFQNGNLVCAGEEVVCTAITHNYVSAGNLLMHVHVKMGWQQVLWDWHHNAMTTDTTPVHTRGVHVGAQPHPLV